MIDEGLRALLLQYPGVTAEISDRVYPAPLPQGVTLPAVTYTDISSVNSFSGNEADCLTRNRYQIDHWAATREEAKRVEMATRRVLNGFFGKMPGGIRIGGIFRRNAWTMREPDTQLWRAVTDYQINAIGE